MKPYEVIAPWYAELMFHVDYVDWAQLILKLLKKQKISPTSLLELGSGDCQLAHHLEIPSLQRRLHTDLVPAMLNAAPQGFAWPRAACDMRRIPVKEGSFDLILLLYDAFNYLMEVDDRDAFYREAHRVLSPGGHLLFDIATERACREWFDGTVDYMEFAEGELVRLSHYDLPSSVQTNHFICYLKMGRGGRYKLEERHQQRIVEVDVVKEELSNYGFELLSTTHEFSMRKAHSKSLRVHFLARRL